MITKKLLGVSIHDCELLNSLTEGLWQSRLIWMVGVEKLFSRSNVNWRSVDYCGSRSSSSIIGWNCIIILCVVIISTSSTVVGICISDDGWGNTVLNSYFKIIYQNLHLTFKPIQNIQHSLAGKVVTVEIHFNFCLISNSYLLLHLSNSLSKLTLNTLKDLLFRLKLLLIGSLLGY